MIFNSNIYDFFGMNHESFRSFYKDLKKYVYMPEMANSALSPAAHETVPAGTRLMTETAHVVKEMPDRKSMDIAFTVASVIAIILFAVLCWLIYDTYLKEPERKVQAQR